MTASTHEAGHRRSRAIGQSVTRLEDTPLVRGEGQFAADISFPNQLHMRIVRSVHAHGLIRRIDTTAAQSMAGVVAVWTANDISDLEPIGFREGHVPELDPYRQYALAKGTVRYVGEPVAAVFADNAYVAEDPADLVSIDIKELSAVTDASAEPAQFDAGTKTEPPGTRKGYRRVAGDFAKAHAIIELDLHIGRHSGVPMETRGAIARYDVKRDVLELHGATKRPHPNRDMLARLLGRSPSSVHLYECHIGGGFGVRGEIYPEDVLVCAGALWVGGAGK